MIAIITPNCLQNVAKKWARHTAPFLAPIGTISVAVPKQVVIELGGPKLVPQKATLAFKIGANFRPTF